MKVAIFYFSATGNTRLACQYLARKLKNVEVDLFDVTKDELPNLDAYVLVGFAAFTDYWGPPHLMQTFVGGLPEQNRKPAFLFATNGGNPVNMLKVFARWVLAKGFVVVGGFTLRVPESFPPSVARGWTSEDSPDEKEMARFDEFIARLNRMIEARVNDGKGFTAARVKIGLLANLVPEIDRGRAKKDMGPKFVDQTICNECGVCEKACPYKAIALSPKPVFDETMCYGCWACFNRCPTKAIYTAKLRGKGHYPKPNAQLQRKLGAV
jgi:ferredoxin